MVGTLRSFTTDMTVPGGTAPCAALTNVTVAATHRRRGILTAMITRDLADSVERGEIVGALIAAEYPIYGRFGYGAAVETQDLEIAPQVALRDPPDGGSVDVRDRRRAASRGPGHLRPGQGRDARGHRPPGPRWDAHLACRAPRAGPTSPTASSCSAATPTASPTASPSTTSRTTGTGAAPGARCTSRSSSAVDTPAPARLWRFCLEVDWVATVKAENQSVDHLLPWLVVDAREVIPVERGDLQWVRILDTAAALAARRYLAPGSVTIAVDDPLGHAAGTFRLEGGPDGAECRRHRGRPTWRCRSACWAAPISAAFPSPRCTGPVWSTSSPRGRWPGPTPCSARRWPPPASPPSDRLPSTRRYEAGEPGTPPSRRRRRRGGGGPGRGPAAIRRVPGSTSRAGSSSRVTQRRPSDSWLPRTTAPAGASTRNRASRCRWSGSPAAWNSWMSRSIGGTTTRRPAMPVSSVGLPQGHGGQVGVAVDVAPGLQPAPHLGVEQHQHALGLGRRPPAPSRSDGPSVHDRHSASGWASRNASMRARVAACSSSGGA